jgi:hypothetical protein
MPFALPQDSPRFSLRGYQAALLKSDVSAGRAISDFGFFLGSAPKQG